MALDKTSDLDSRKSSSCGLVITIAIIILLAVGYTVFRTLTVPRHDINQTTQPTK
ncbi:hypothetical protein HDF16_003305 [Granulicella aggregans]|uniref:Uncharacterized protein n=1 Tax=Granulicella aggregans TaxID=474949 RepID=A0A7W8E4J7_9BACT|nr:hypothetical protein [Granulicella aggregans]